MRCGEGQRARPILCMSRLRDIPEVDEAVLCVPVRIFWVQTLLVDNKRAIVERRAPSGDIFPPKLVWQSANSDST